MRWLFEFNKLELVLFIVSIATVMAGLMLLLDIAGVSLINGP
jgi:hypothetical protein